MPQLLTRLSIGTIIACLSLGACGRDQLKRITIEMMSRKGALGQEDRASLYFQKGSVDCSLNFYSEQSVKYIESIGPAPVPVVFDVSYTDNGKPSGATLVRVGKWRASKFQQNERLLATTEVTQLGYPGETIKSRIDSPGGCFDALPPTKAIHFSSGATTFLLIVGLNVALLAVAFLYSRKEASGEPPSRRKVAFGAIALALAAGSQLLFVAYAVSGRLGLVRFYPGNPVQLYAILTGLILSASALITALLGNGLKRIAGALVAVTTTGLWVLAAIASVAV